MSQPTPAKDEAPTVTIDPRAQVATAKTQQRSDSSDTTTLPSVGVVIATHERPTLMRRALNSVLDQAYNGMIHVVLVFDRSEPDTTLERQDPQRTVRAVRNSRTPGLAGARNTGIMALDTDLVAFCDDDDEWMPGKLLRQVDRLLSAPDAQFVTTSMLVECAGQKTVRTADAGQVTLHDLTRSRMAMLHSSSFVFRRTAMTDGFGLVDEDIPQSMAEDWDLLLRAARECPIEHVDEPLVLIHWGATSYFNQAWASKNAARLWLLEHHPELRRDSKGYALQLGKLAFGHAVLNERRAALATAARAIRHNWHEPRGYLAVAVLSGLSGNWLQQTLNRRGHGI